MLKFLETRDEVVDLIHNLSEAVALQSFKVGVAGSYVTGLNKKSSSIDIVLKLRSGSDSSLVGNLDICAYIHRSMVDVYSNKIRIIWLDLLESDEVSLLSFVKSFGLEANPESVYTNIVENITWVDTNDSDDVDDLDIEDLDVDDLDDLDVDDLDVEDLDVEDLDVENLDVEDLDVEDLDVKDLDVKDLEEDTLPDVSLKGVN